MTNKYTFVMHVNDTPPDGVFPAIVHRPSVYGNPYLLGVDGTRKQVIDMFRRDWYSPAYANIRERARKELTGKALACFCKPYPCHADIIADWLNGEDVITLCL